MDNPRKGQRAEISAYNEEQDDATIPQNIKTPIFQVI